MKHQEISTDRFILKILTPELVGEEYLSWFSSPETSQYIYYSKQSVSFQGLKDYVKQKFECDNTLFFGIYLKDSMKHIGNIKYEPVDFNLKYTVMGILIGDNNWRGKKVFVEIDNVLKESLKKIGILSIYLGVDKTNEAAIKAYLKAGYEIDHYNFLKLDENNLYTMVKKL